MIYIYGQEASRETKPSHCHGLLFEIVELWPRNLSMSESKLHMWYIPAAAGMKGGNPDAAPALAVANASAREEGSAPARCSYRLQLIESLGCD